MTKDPAAYSGKEVEVYAYYKYGAEQQELYCSECDEVPRIWVSEEKLDTKIRRKMPSKAGIIRGVFVGIFDTSKVSFGDGSYRSALILKYIREMNVVVNGLPKDGVVPKASCGSCVTK